MNPYHTTHSLISGSAQAITIGTASATVSSTLPGATTGVRVVANTGCWYRVDGSAAAAAGAFLPANVIEYAPCDSSAQVSILAATTAGTFWMTPTSG